jgi:hypothetical protein
VENVKSTRNHVLSVKRVNFGGENCSLIRCLEWQADGAGGASGRGKNFTNIFIKHREKVFHKVEAGRSLSGGGGGRGQNKTQKLI